MKEFSPEQRALFFNAILKELIKNSVKKVEIYRLEKLIEDKYGVPASEDRREVVKELIERREKIRKNKLENKDLKSSIDDLSNYSLSVFETRAHPRKKIVKKIIRPIRPIRPSLRSAPPGGRVLRVPAPKLPPRLSYLKPSLNSSEQIELGKLLVFANDPNVKVIEIEGSDKNVFVSGVMGKKKTGVILNKEEVEGIINNFSSRAKIPLSEGVNKIAYGGFVLNAIVSEGIDKRFSLKKIEETKGSGVQVAGGHLKRRVF